ncbi:MAG: Ig-like domain-containing protein [Deltaproteobacteria bacterium]|nr:Ig-like domain-containing protein [Deltaproteobacteria bacterium]
MSALRWTSLALTLLVACENESIFRQKEAASSSTSSTSSTSSATTSGTGGDSTGGSGGTGGAPSTASSSQAASGAGGSGGEGGAGGDGATLGSGGSGGAGGAGGNGPKLLSSTPKHGDMQAPLGRTITLYFDRPVSSAFATGKLRAHSTKQPVPVFTQVLPCTDFDPACLSVPLPKSLVQKVGYEEKLFGDTEYTLTIDKSFQDSDGNVNLVDQKVVFKTFGYNPSLFDDGATVPNDTGGLEYAPEAQSLYLLGMAQGNSGHILRRLALDANFNITGATTEAGPVSGGGGPFAYGMSHEPGKLRVAWTYANTLHNYAIGGGGTLALVTSYSQTGLPSPDSVLDQTASVANLGGKVYVGGGYFTGNGSAMSGVLELLPATGTFSVWKAKGGLFDKPGSFHVGAGTIQNEGFVFVANQDRILKIRQADKVVVNTHIMADTWLDGPQLRVDSKGRLWMGMNSGLTVFDTAGANGFSKLVELPGIAVGRFALREDGAKTHVYFVPYRGKGVVGTTTLTL